MKRREFPFAGLLSLFAAFILFCGIGHLIEMTIFWHPWYRLSGLCKALTAVVSWATVIAVVPAIPRALGLPGMANANTQLREEVRQQQKMKEELQRQSEQLQTAYDDLDAFTKTVFAREERVIELKREVNELARALGQQPRYVEMKDASSA